jgi:hypothetical protein
MLEGDPGRRNRILHRASKKAFPVLIKVQRQPANVDPRNSPQELKHSGRIFGPPEPGRLMAPDCLCLKRLPIAVISGQQFGKPYAVKED